MRRAKYEGNYFENSFSLRKSSKRRMILLASSHKLSERLVTSANWFVACCERARSSRERSISSLLSLKSSSIDCGMVQDLPPVIGYQRAAKLLTVLSDEE